MRQRVGIAQALLNDPQLLFEILYLLLWYIGPINAAPLDYTKTAYATTFGIATLALACAAFCARRVRLAAA